MRSALVAIVVVIAVIQGLPAEPCCMVPKTYKGTIGQSAQEALLIHHDGREELILKISYKITGEAMPAYFAWVITVPTEPDSYAVADAKLFEEVFNWAQSYVDPPARVKVLGAKNDAAAGLEFGKRVQVGPYDIQPVRARGREALQGLNGWLEKSGFPTEDPEHMKYFVDNKFTFLCVKIVPPEGKKEVESAGGVPPLHLSFQSEHPYYPLRFSSRQGVFDLNLYILTQGEFDYAASEDSLKRINWAENVGRNAKVTPDGFPKTLKDVYAKTKFKDYAGEWRLNVIRTYKVNQGDSISKWKEDVFFRTKA